MGSLSALGKPLGLKRWLWRRPGGPEKKGSKPRWLQGPPRNSNVTNTDVFVILQKLIFFFRMAPVGFQEGPGRAPKVVGAPQLGPREPSGKLIRSIGALFWRSWICKR